MTGRVEVSDREIADAIAVDEDEMLELLRRLVEAPTTLGNEEPGQDIVLEAFGWSSRRAARPSPSSRWRARSPLA